jgi:hypothetical protein
VTPIGKMAYEGFTMNISKTITPSIIEAITPVVENAIDKRLTTFENNHFSSLSSYLVELNKILAEKKILTAEELTVLNEKAVKIGPN